MRGPPRTSPSTAGTARSIASRSSRPDSRKSARSRVYPASAAASSAPRVMSKYTGLVTSGMTSATIELRPVDNARAGGLVR